MYRSSRCCTSWGSLALSFYVVLRSRDVISDAQTTDEKMNGDIRGRDEM